MKFVAEFTLSLPYEVVPQISNKAEIKGMSVPAYIENLILKDINSSEEFRPQIREIFKASANSQ